jgi:hypothetical protein
MAVIPDKPNCPMVLITKTTTNLGMGWNAVRSRRPSISPLCP